MYFKPLKKKRSESEGAGNYPSISTNRRFTVTSSLSNFDAKTNDGHCQECEEEIAVCFNYFIARRHEQIEMAGQNFSRTDDDAILVSYDDVRQLSYLFAS